MDQGNGHNIWCSNCVFKVYAFCHHCSTLHEVPNRLGSTMLVCPTHCFLIPAIIVLLIIILEQSTMRAPFFKVMICMTTMIVQLAKLLGMTAIVCMIPVTAMSPPPFSMVVVPMKNQSKVFFNWLNGCKFYNNSYQDKIGFIPHKTDDIPVPPQLQISSSCQLNMSPHELELMLFKNENFLLPSIFDKVMKQACVVTANRYKFDSPSYSTLKKRMNYTFPNTINGWWWFKI